MRRRNVSVSCWDSNTDHPNSGPAALTAGISLPPHIRTVNYVTVLSLLKGKLGIYRCKKGSLNFLSNFVVNVMALMKLRSYNLELLPRVQQWSGERVEGIFVVLSSCMLEGLRETTRKFSLAL
jgi:hypothetical protein